MNNLSLSIFGLDDIKEYLNPDRINKSLAIGVGEAVLQLHNALRTSVFQRYERPNDLNKALIRRNSIAETGRGFIKDGLLYKDTSTNMASFPYTPTIQSRLHPLNLNKEWGNLYESKPKKGLVHSASVVRRQTKVIHGKYKKGGFVVRKSGKVVMLQRISQERYPVKGVYGLNLIDMALIRLASDNTVKHTLDRLELAILERFIP